MPPKKRRGAPTKPARDRKEDHITVWMTADQKDLMSRAAGKSGDADGTWLRKVGVRAAREQLGEEGGDGE